MCLVGSPRDFIHDLDAHLGIKAVDFQVQQLSMWQELVAPRVAGASVLTQFSSVELEAAEEAVADATYRETVARIAVDEKDFLEWKLSKSKSDNRSHVVMVQHHRAQNAKGIQCATCFALLSAARQHKLFCQSPAVHSTT